MRKPNIVDFPKGRKYKWGNVKYIGEFTLIDFIFCFIIVILGVALFFLISIWIALIINIFFYLLLIILIKEWSGYKSYELFIDMFKFIYKDKHIEFSEILEDEIEEDENE